MRCPQCDNDLPRKMRFCINCRFDFSSVPGFFDTPQLPSGFILNRRYRVQEYVTSGGMAYIYKIEELQLGKTYALKEMMNYFTNDDERQRAVDRFAREAEILSKLTHPSIPRIVDFFSENDRHYLIMDFIEGEDLDTVLLKQESGRLSQEKVLELLWKLIDLFKYLHNLRPPLIYRDLKPANILITSEERVFLIDFGIARLFVPQTKGTLIGTPGYTPPEQYKGVMDVRADIYALGATLHHLLTGKDPRQEIPFDFEPVEDIVPDVDPTFARLVKKSLSYRMDERFQNIEELAEFLEESDLVSEARKLFNKGMMKLKKKEYSESVGFFNEVITREPDNYFARVNRGIAFKKEGKFALAISDFKEALGLRPDIPDLNFYLGSALVANLEFDQAKQIFQKLIKLDPGDFRGYYQLGKIYKEENSFDRALEMFKKALLCKPDFEKAELEIKELLGRQKTGKRIKEYDQAVTEDVDPLRAYYKLGMYFLEWGRLEEAEAEFLKAQKIIPDDFDLLLGMGELYSRMEKFERSACFYARAVLMKPEDYNLYILAGENYLEGGKEKSAMEILRLGVEEIICQDEDLEDNEKLVIMLGMIIEILENQGECPAGALELKQALEKGEEITEAFDYFWRNLKKIR
ncbi:MAG: protein kinase domain-containing protein [Vulcanimicrobiota bacterium]